MRRTNAVEIAIAILALASMFENHVLKAAPLSRSENIATYYDPELPLADGLMEPIAGCIERVSRLGEGGG